MGDIFESMEESRITRLSGKALEIHRILDSFSPQKIEFLHFRNSYELLISVILSAQTTDRQVIQVTGLLFKKYPGPEELACAKIEDIMELIKSTGFYRVKAQNIRKTAIALVENFSGKVPRTMEELLTLPGVGRKSANVLLGTVFGRPAVIVDTHFKRVVNRLGLAETGNPDIIENIIKQLLDEKYQYRFSMTVNLHGRQTCHAAKPECGKCAVSAMCDYFTVK